MVVSACIKLLIFFFRACITFFILVLFMHRTVFYFYHTMYRLLFSSHIKSFLFCIHIIKSFLLVNLYTALLFFLFIQYTNSSFLHVLYLCINYLCIAFSFFFYISVRIYLFMRYILLLVLYISQIFFIYTLYTISLCIYQL